MARGRAWMMAGLTLAAGVGLAYWLSERRPRLGPESRILLVGDSMAQGLAPYLRALATEEGLAFRALAVQGTTISAWSDNAELASVLESFNPTIVLIALGTNDEYLSPSGLAAEADDLNRLLELVADRDVAWVGVPSLPKDSNGAVDLIRGTGVSYFPTERLDLARAPDEIHPTAAGYSAWAGALWYWMS